jgi:hypothetical protein
MRFLVDFPDYPEGREPMKAGADTKICPIATAVTDSIQIFSQNQKWFPAVRWPRKPVW